MKILFSKRSENFTNVSYFNIENRTINCWDIVIRKWWAVWVRLRKLQFSCFFFFKPLYLSNQRSNLQCLLDNFIANFLNLSKKIFLELSLMVTIFKNCKTANISLKSNFRWLYLENGALYQKICKVLFDCKFNFALKNNVKLVFA